MKLYQFGFSQQKKTLRSNPNNFQNNRFFWETFNWKTLFCSSKTKMVDIF